MLGGFDAPLKSIPKCDGGSARRILSAEYAADTRTHRGKGARRFSYISIACVRWQRRA